MIFAAHQPHYLPWLRYLYKIAAADIFVLLDDAQFTKNGWQNRTRIKGAEEAVLLTVPLHASLGAAIREVKPAGGGWMRKHLAALDACYGAAVSPWRSALSGVLERHADADLASLNVALLHLLLEGFAIDTPVVRSSELGINGRASGRLADIGGALGADAYLSGSYALDAYLDPAPFAAAGIDLVVQRWNCPEYSQRFPATGFVEDLSALDLLVNEPDSCGEILLAGGEVTALEEVEPRGS